MITIYVDDFTMAIDPDHMILGWMSARRVVQHDLPTQLGLYLGCNHHVGTATSRIRIVRTMTYGMEPYLQS